MPDLMLLNKRVLITQADAFMGPALCEVFARHGATVLASTAPLVDAGAPAALLAQAGIGLAVRKQILAERGVIASAAVRKPGPKLSAADMADMARLTARQTRRLAELG